MRALIQLLLTLITLSAFGWGVWQGFLFLNSRGQELDPAQRSLLAGVALIVLVGIFLLTYAIRDAAREQTKAVLLSRRLELYEGFLVSWQTLKKELPNDETRIQFEADELKTSIVLFGSPYVVKELNRLLKKTTEEGPIAAQEEFQSLLLAMRTDLGQSSLYPLRNELKKLFATSKP
jgi:hypothetical protein